MSVIKHITCHIPKRESMYFVVLYSYRCLWCSYVSIMYSSTQTHKIQHKTHQDNTTINQNTIFEVLFHFAEPADHRSWCLLIIEDGWKYWWILVMKDEDDWQWKYLEHEICKAPWHRIRYTWYLCTASRDEAPLKHIQVITHPFILLSLFKSSQIAALEIHPGYLINGPMGFTASGGCMSIRVTGYDFFLHLLEIVSGLWAHLPYDLAEGSTTLHLLQKLWLTTYWLRRFH
jgi:hypothetical protein